jgi:hypothetical protein
MTDAEAQSPEGMHARISDLEKIVNDFSVSTAGGLTAKGSLREGLAISGPQGQGGDAGTAAGGAEIPTPPDSGTFVLGSEDGAFVWFDTSTCT